MKRRIVTLAGLTLLVFLAGCPDSLTKLLKDNKYAPVVPISDGCCLGDVYSGNLTDLIGTVYIDKDYPEIYSRIAGFTRPASIYLPEVSGRETFGLSVNANIIGKVQGQLKASGAKRFRVNIEDPCTYSMSEHAFGTYVYPELVKSDPNANYIGMYVVTSLLKAKKLEYELTDERDVNITVSPQGTKKFVITEIGMTSDTNNHYKLYTSTPSYIGWKLSQINASGGFGPQTTRELGAVLRTKSSEALLAKEAKVEKLNEEQSKLLESIRTKEVEMKKLNEEQAKLMESIRTKAAEMKKLNEAQTRLSESVQAKESKMEKLYEAQATPSGHVAVGVKTEELRTAQTELAAEKAKMEELNGEQVKLMESIRTKAAETKKLNEPQTQLWGSMQTKETRMEKLYKTQATPSGHIATGVKTEGLRTAQTELAAEKAKMEELRTAKDKSWESLLAEETKMEKLYETQVELAASTQAKEAKVEKLYEAQATPSGHVATGVKTEELRTAKASLSAEKAKMKELHTAKAELVESVLAEGEKAEKLRKAQDKLSASVQTEEANMEKLRKAQDKLSESLLAERTNMEELNKARAKLAKSIVLTEVPMEELRKAQVTLKK